MNEIKTAINGNAEELEKNMQEEVAENEIVEEVNTNAD